MQTRTCRIIAYRLFTVSGLLVLLFCLLFYAEDLKYTDGETGNTVFTVDNGSGFYTEDVLVSVSAPRKTEVWYTMDCSEPSPEGESSVLYEEPVLLEVTPDERVQTIKMKAWYENEEGEPAETKTYTYTYILGTGVQSRYDTLVVSVTGDPEDFFGYEKGIFVEGKLRDEFLAANPGYDGDSGDANYKMRGPESERKANVQVFSPEGMVLLNQNCGLRILGNATRMHSQKSMQLFARHSYDEWGTFHAALFPDTRKESDGTFLDRENRLSLRACGDDFNHGFMRDALIQSLARQAGFEMAREDRPVAVYLNDEYYGMSWLREPFSTGAVENEYGAFNGEFVKLNLGEHIMRVNEEASEEKNAELLPYMEEYNEIYRLCAEGDLKDDAVYQELTEKIDVENYLWYYALEMYIGNADWPFNNVNAYRYVSDTGEYAEEGIFDGRYRYLLFDTDYSLLLSAHYTAYAADADTVELLIRTEHSPVFNSLMTRQDCRDTVVNDFCDLMNGVFRYENACETLMEMDDARRNELEHFLSESDLPDEAVTMDTVDAEVELMRSYLEERPKYMYGILEANFPVCRTYELFLTGGGGARVTVNSIKNIEGDFRGIYYAECGLNLKAETQEGRKFAGWLINGEEYQEEELTLDKEDLWRLLQIPEDAQNGEPAEYLRELQIEVITEADEDTEICIAAIHEKGSGDVVCLYNPGEERRSTKGLYLSDEAGKPDKYSVPERELEPGEILILYGKKHAAVTDGCRLSFNIKNGEELIFSDASGETLEKITVPGLTQEDTWYVKNLYTGKYEETRKEQLPGYLKELAETEE